MDSWIVSNKVESKIQSKELNVCSMQCSIDIKYIMNVLSTTDGGLILLFLN